MKELEELENKYTVCDINFEDSEEYAQTKIRNARSETLHSIINKFIVTVLLIGIIAVLYMIFMNI